MKTEKMDINAVCFGILCNFTPVCGEERAKEAVALIRSLQAELEQARQDCAVAEKNHMRCENQLRQAKAERDAAIKDIPHKCWSCRNGFYTENGFDCNETHYKSGHKDCLSWQWRGVKED